MTEHLKNRRDGLIARIDALLKEVSILEQQLAAFDIILKDYDENYRPGGVVRAHSRKPPKVPASSVTPLLKDVDQRGTLLRILREADASVSTADCARKLAVQIGLFDAVVIHNRQVSNTGCAEVLQHCATQSTGADHQNAGVA